MEPKVSDPCYQVISDLEVHPSRLEKEAIILAQAEWKNDEFFEGCQLALDPLITFGVKQVPEKKDADGPGLDWNSFNLLAVGLRDRHLTGHDARDAINEAVKQSTKRQWNDWYRRILIKDLRCGVSEKTINKVVERKYCDYSIPVFGCQLAHDSANHEGKVTGSKLIEVKLDGVRVITIVYPDGRVDQFSRNGKELVNFPHIKEQFAAVAQEGGISEPTVFDGEVMSSSFQDLMKQVHRKSNVKAQDATLNLFDIIPLVYFESGKCATKQVKRSQLLKVWHDTWEDLVPNITVVGQELVDLNTSTGQKLFKEINQRAIDGGYEGIMIKDPMAPYECKRSHSWLKLKPFIEVSLTVTSVEEGTGKNIGKLGALVCEGVDDGRSISVNVGSGFTDNNRDDYWKGRDEVVGKVVEVRADAITQNQDGSYSLRFPRFLHFRGFKDGEKI
jgi:DNA ligase-1